MSQYFIAPDVYLCFADAHAVFLDLSHNKFLALGATQARDLRAVVGGWSIDDPSVADSDTALEPSAIAVAEALVEKSLLTRDASVGNSFAPIALEPAETTLIESDTSVRSRIRPGNVATFLCAYTSVALDLRCRSIRSIVHRVRVRKEQALRAGAHFDLPIARQIFAIYRRLQPFMLPTQQPSLVDSLTLVQLLSRYRLFPSWVFGVRPVPFGVHTWVQQEGMVLNGTPESVRKFMPIMVV